MRNKQSLADLVQGNTAIISELSSNGTIRRRLQDIGFIPGTKVVCIQSSPLGDPVAYLIRGAVIALRHEDASCILVSPGD